MLIFAAIALLYTGAGFLPGRTFAPLDLPLDAGAWKPDPAQRVRVSNSLLSDVITQFIPWEREMRRLFARGEFPWINRYAGEGGMLYADPGTGLLSPFTWPRLLFDLDGWVIASFLKILAAAFCSYWLARELDVPPNEALISGLVFAMCGYTIVWLLWPHSSIFALLPGLAASAIRLVKQPRARHGALVIGFAALCTAGGHPETLFVGVVGIAIFLIWEAERQPGLGVMALVPSAVGALLGFLLMFVQLVPFFVVLGESHAAGHRPAVMHSFRSWAALSQVLPGILGSPLRGELDLTAFAHGESFNHRAGGYVGALVLLALAAAWRSLAPTLRRGLLIGGVALVLSWYPPGVWAVFRHIPLLRMLALEYGAVLFALFGSLAAGPAITAMTSSPRRMLGAALIIAGMVMLIGAAMPRSILTRAARAGIETLKERGHLQQSAEVYEQRLGYYLEAGRATALRRVALPGLCFILGGVALLRRRTLLFASAAVAELIAFGYGYNPAVQMTEVPRQPATIAAIKRLDPANHHLIAATAEVFPANLGTLYQVRDVIAYDALNRAVRIEQLVSAGYDPQLHSFGATFTREQTRVLASLGVRYVLSRTAIEGTRKIAGPSVPAVGVYEIDEAIPIAMPRNTLPRGIVAGAIVSVLAALASLGWLRLYKIEPITQLPPSTHVS